ncbi:hypothetical protein J7K74_03575 [Candidatus Woesearchaeota archaeon]|nr:hypothetical protein [Candidatus Woesearchaeota archaeon]
MKGLYRKIKGRITESRFKEWLDKHGIPYWYIQQDLKTFSLSIKKMFGVKRPDFMILIPNIGFILVDVKYKRLVHGYKKFPLDVEEVARYSSLQRYFNLQVWYVISNEDYNYKTWFWIPVSKVLEEGKMRRFTSSRSGEEFFAIPITSFIQIADDDSLERLFSKCFIGERGS